MGLFSFPFLFFHPTVYFVLMTLDEQFSLPCGTFLLFSFFFSVRSTNTNTTNNSTKQSAKQGASDGLTLNNGKEQGPFASGRRLSLNPLCGILGTFFGFFSTAQFPPSPSVLIVSLTVQHTCPQSAYIFFSPRMLFMDFHSFSRLFSFFFALSCLLTVLVCCEAKVQSPQTKKHKMHKKRAKKKRKMCKQGWGIVQTENDAKQKTTQLTTNTLV